MKAKTVSKPVSKPVSDYDSDDYKAKDDARTLTSAAEIQNDPDRHKAAAGHLEKQAQASGDAHKNARKVLEKKTKKRMNKVFGGDKDKNFAAAQDSEKGGTEKIVDEE